jgi:Uma2 family endonuclease
LFVSRHRLEVVQERIYGAPDLVIEILSPHPRIGRLDERIDWFATYGVREIWLYHQPERRMEILACHEGAVAARRSFGWADRLASDVLPLFNEALGVVLESS